MNAKFWIFILINYNIDFIILISESISVKYYYFDHWIKNYNMEGFY